MKRRYRVGVLGLDHWYWGLNIVPQIARHPRLELASLWESQGWRLRDLDASGYRLEAGAREIVEDPGLDVVLSLLPSKTGAPWLARAAAAGKALICNKPLAFDMKGAEAVVRALGKSGRPSFCLEGGSQLSNRTRFVKGILGRCGLGRILTITMGMRGGMPKAWKDMDTWRANQVRRRPRSIALGKRVDEGGWGWWTDPKLVPGGAWIDHSIYAMAELRGLLGGEPIAATGIMGNLKYPRRVLDMEDYGLVSYRYKSGALANLEYDWIGGTGVPTVIVCEKGRIRWGAELPQDAVELRTGKGTKLLKVPKGRPESVLDHLVRCLDQGRDTVQPARLGALNLRAALAAYRSARLGRTVTV
jgi:predicted dehydrogenase